MGARLRILPAAVAVFALGITALCSCGDEHRYYVENVSDGEKTPTMLTTDVSTLISDSGYTRYKIEAAVWAMYDEARDPFWKFPEELHLEQYDQRMRVNSTMRCDSATYFSQRRLWRLDGRVVVVNTMRDSFLTNQVFWDQQQRKVYSDSFVHIVRSDRVIEGYGFTSNEQMTEYAVNKPTGIFPVKDKPASDEQPAAQPAPAAASPATMTPVAIDSGPAPRPISRRPVRITR